MSRKRDQPTRSMPKQYAPIRFGEPYNPASVEGQYRANTSRNRRIQDDYHAATSPIKVREPLLKRLLKSAVRWMFAPIRPGV